MEQGINKEERRKESDLSKVTETALISTGVVSSAVILGAGAYYVAKPFLYEMCRILCNFNLSGLMRHYSP